MNKILKKSICFMAALIMTFSFPTVAFAQGTTSISITNSSVAVGDYTTVSVTASSSGKVTVKYTASLLTLIDCTASGYSYEGNTITFSGTSGDIKFKAAAEGTASIIVSSSTCTGSSTTISVGSTAAAPAETTQEPAETTTDAPADEDSADTTSVEAPASTGTGAGVLNENGGFDIDGVSYVVSERYSDSEIPSGFSKKTITIGSSTYNELTNDTITIIYLKPADNVAGSGEFYIYNEANGTVSKLVMVGNAKSYVMIANVTTVLSEALSETTLTTDSGSCTAYVLDDSEFYYIYGMNQDGVAGWFMYDNEYGTITRADEKAVARISDAVDPTEIAAEAADDTEYNPVEVYQKKLEKFRLIVSALVILCVVLVFIIINLASKRGRDYIDDDEDDEIDEKPRKRDDGDIFATTPKRSSKKIPRSIVFEDPTASDEEDEEEEEDFPKKEKRPTKEQKNHSSSGLDMMDLNDL